MKSHIKIFTPVLLAILVGSLTFVFAQTRDGGKMPKGDGPRGFRPPPPPGGPGFGFPPHVLEQLNLTDTQKEQIKTLEDGARASAEGNFDQIRSFDDQLKAMIDGGTFDEGQARQILNNKAQIMTELQIVRLKTDFAIRNLLTAEQRTQLDQLKQQRPPRPPDGFAPGMPPPPPAPPVKEN
ncbi:MAG: Spy/CpxP family protein refolding chaperone [Pyrinomonadaceae bacterium]